LCLRDRSRPMDHRSLRLNALRPPGGYLVSSLISSGTPMRLSDCLPRGNFGQPPCGSRKPSPALAPPRGRYELGRPPGNPVSHRPQSAVTGRSSRPREIGRVRLKRTFTIPLPGAGARRRSASVKQRCVGTHDLIMIRREARRTEVANERDT